MNKDFKKLIIFMLILLFLIVIIFILIFNKSAAKYVNETNWEHGLYVNGFYITSNLLGEDTITTFAHEYDGDNLEISLRNYDGKYKITDYDISYKLECLVEDKYKSDFECVLDDKSVNVLEGNLENKEGCYQDGKIVNLDEDICKKSKGDFKSVPNELKHNIKLINKTGREVLDPLSVNILLTTTSPYKKVLNGKVIIDFSKDMEIKIGIREENSRYCNVVISNESVKSKQLELTINSDAFLLDTSDNNLNYISKNGVGEINKFQTSINSFNQFEFKLLKKSEESSCDSNIITYKILN